MQTSEDEQERMDRWPLIAMLVLPLIAICEAINRAWQALVGTPKK
jgi:hypothetical protein